MMATQGWSGGRGTCLTLTPEYGATPINPPGWATLYGAEYQHFGDHHDRDVPCTVCKAPHSTTIMLGATLTCPEHWTKQYSGHLSAGHHGHPAATEYVCLDGDPEEVDGGAENKDGYLFYYTKTMCGSLPCPPYEANGIATCVVCSN